ncbi:MAG TPA: hypothetical protein VKB80_31335 [Kofleriaceae bacterium]|nr:hypothetical protein [Kofleriaceae bacterium]
MLGRGVILALIIGAAARVAVAAPDYEAARRHYQAAEKAAAEGKHSLAAHEYGMAYEITKDPVLFFKIGVSYDRAGDCTSAKVYYLRYLKEGKPAPEFRKRTEALIAACKNRPNGGHGKSADAASGPPSSSDSPPGEPSAISSASRRSAPGPAPTSPAPTSPAPTASGPTPPTLTPPTLPPPTPAPTAAPPTDATRAATRATPPPPDRAATRPPADDSLTGAPRFVDEEPPSWQRTAAWTSVGITIALGTTAAVLGLSAASREEDVHNLIDFRDPEGRPAIYTGPTRDRYRDLTDEGDRLEKLSVAALAATGAAAAASAVFFVLDGMRAGGEERERASVLAPVAAPGGAGLSWNGSF